MVNTMLAKSNLRQAENMHGTLVLSCPNQDNLTESPYQYTYMQATCEVCMHSKYIIYYTQYSYGINFILLPLVHQFHFFIVVKLYKTIN